MQFKAINIYRYINIRSYLNMCTVQKFLFFKEMNTLFRKEALRLNVF